MAHVEHVGYDATRREDTNDLPLVLEEWKKYKKNEKDYSVFTQIRTDLWVAKVNFSQVKNKLDVEAYGKEYIETIEKIQNLKNDSVEIVALSGVMRRYFCWGRPQKIRL